MKSLSETHPTLWLEVGVGICVDDNNFWYVKWNDVQEFTVDKAKYERVLKAFLDCKEELGRVKGQFSLFRDQIEGIIDLQKTEHEREVNISYAEGFNHGINDSIDKHQEVWIHRTEHERLVAVRRKDAFIAGELLGEKNTLEQVRKAIESLRDHYAPYRPVLDTDKQVGARESLDKLYVEIGEGLSDEQKKTISDDKEEGEE